MSLFKALKEMSESMRLDLSIDQKINLRNQWKKRDNKRKVKKFTA